MITTAGVVTMDGVATTVAGDILAGVITMGGGIPAGGTVGGTTNPRVLRPFSSSSRNVGSKATAPQPVHP